MSFHADITATVDSWDVDRWIERARQSGDLWVDGKVTRVIGISAEACTRSAAIGDFCQINSPRGPIPAEVVGFNGTRVLLMPLADLRGIAVGARVIRRRGNASVPVGEGLLGRVVDGFGRPIDGEEAPVLPERRDLYAAPLSPMQREPVRKPLFFGIRVIDSLLTCGEGQRLGIVAGPGIGKTVLLSMIAERSACDVLVIGLVGERGREVVDFVQRFQASASRNRTVVIAATSDRPPLERMRAALFATSVAEYFRDQGKRVLLVMDSLTRVAMAQREVGLAVGEPPTTKGYPPSVFAKLPQLLERPGARRGGGSITGIYTVLMEGDDITDPVAETAISILDGQMVLSRRLAGRGHYPAIDVLTSISRVFDRVTDPAQQHAARDIREMIGVLHDNEDLLNIGAYQPGSNPKLDRALTIQTELSRFLRQDPDEVTNPADTLRWLEQLAAQAGQGQGIRG